MTKMLAVATASLFLALAAGANSTRAASLGEAMELEAARANARAGGPVSARDHELLERYGCLSGTNNPVCGRLNRAKMHPAPQRAHKRRP